MDITQEDLKDLETVRNYFGEHDKTTFEHQAYSILDSLLHKLKNPNIELSTQIIQWPCPNCNQDTSQTEWICCCSQECLKQWLDKNNDKTTIKL